jgi:hypothetical protein
MTEPIQDGRPLASGTITAEDQQAEIHRAAAPDQRLTPAQHRKRMSNEFVGPGPEGFSRVSVRGDDVAVLFGQRPPRRRTDPAEADATWGRIDAAKADGPSPQKATRPEEAKAAVQREARRLLEDFKQHAARVVKDAAAARGTPREAAAVKNLNETVSVGKRLKEKLVK